MATAVDKRAAHQPEPRTVALPEAAAAKGNDLMTAQEGATIRYLDWAEHTLNAMKLPPPKEGHRWIVDTRAGKVEERPL